MTHATHDMHQNSLATYAAERGKMKSRRELVKAAFKAIGAEATYRTIMNALGFTDMNAVRPRISERLDAGWLSEVGSVLCPVGGRTVRVCKIKRYGED